MRSIKIRLIPVFFIFLGTLFANAQDPNRFKEQIDELVNREYNFNPDKKLVVFTGSSSIRMWKDVADYFPDYNVINNGFGGSHFSDLLYFYNEMIVKPAPEILFIYEGDNDIASDKKPNKILKETKELAEKIQQDLPNTRVVFISPKPSIARVHLKNQYISFNKKLKKYCAKQNNVGFADVWYPMLDNKGNVYKDVFIEDGLHMNKKGYDIWAKVIGEFLQSND
ncbi:MAG: G-D-S-L family lipolytic protein [Bacteroidetes bacterium]|nr:MAG: G-D-S-L family lipolytic protein [Bacteroidota bacterium]